MIFNITPEVEKLRGPMYRNKRFKGTFDYITRPCGIIVDEPVKRKLMQQGYSFDDARDNSSAYDPQIMFDRLHTYATKRCLNVNQEAWDQAYAITLGAFTKGCNHSLKQNIQKEYLRERIHGDKASGAPYFKTKAEVFENDFSRMWRWLEDLKAPEPCVAIHRVQHGDDGPKNRLVWEYPQSVTLAEMSFFEPLTDWFHSHRMPIPYGCVKSEYNARLSVIRQKRYKYETDFSRFDSYQHASLIHMAFNIIRAFFGEYNEKHLNLIESYYVNTPIIMPDGYIYTVHQGAPSGSRGITIVNTIIQFFAVEYAFIRCTGKKIEEECQVPYGDDNVIGSDYYVAPERLENTFAELGLKLSTEKTAMTQTEKLHYLGHEWYCGIPHRESWDVVRHMIYPERSSKEKDGRMRVLNRIYPYIADSYEAFDIIQKFNPKVNYPQAILMRSDLILTTLPEWYALTEGRPEKMKGLSGEQLFNFATRTLYI